MEDFVLQNTWKQYNAMLEESKLLNLQAWAVNRQTLEMLQTEKAKKKLNRAIFSKALGIAAGVIWQCLLGNIAFYAIMYHNICLSAAAIICMTVNVISVASYIKHIWLIKQVDNSGTIVEAQQKLAALQASTIQAVRIAFLQAPAYAIFYITPGMLHNGQAGWWALQIAITGLLVFLSIWLYRNINIKNINKKWLNVLLNSISWAAMLEAMRFLKEVEAFKNEG